MHGGMKVYRGSAAAARNYLDVDRSRADDYYLTEGTGVARRFVAGPDGPAVELAALTGDAYERWVDGIDPDNGERRGRLRTDASAVRFVEIIVNGPKSWSLAAELHPDVAVAYEAAQDRAAEQIIAWLGAHATTRVGPRGAQAAVQVERLEAVTVRHYTSRAGDPHRHLHLQVNARVYAAGKWRGLDTVAVRDSLAALNGIGHAAVVCDPGFRAALAAHGYTLTTAGEIEQLAQFVGPFSKRAAQIGNLLDRYEAAWRREHPEQEPGPGLRRGWDVRAWAEDRPDKLVPQDGAQLRHRWLDELAALGYRDRDRPVQLALELPGQLDRDAAAAEVVARLSAARSAWNAADLRGEVEQLLAREHLATEAAVRGELAEDLTARALELCVPLHQCPAPEHVRSLTSHHVLDVEADLVARLAARSTAGAEATHDRNTIDGLDHGQRRAIAVLTGDAQLVVVEGAAGAGKTTTLAAARHALAEQGHSLVVVTPTLKAAQAATAEIGASAGSAAWLAYQHGWRWNDMATWTRLETEPAPAAVLRAGDLLLVDEAGMLDQDTARALLTIADEHDARLALVGDRRQLPAVGRGGILQLAARWVDPAAHVELDTVHRFTCEGEGADGAPTRVPDLVYALVTLQMRDGHEPAVVFAYLHAHRLVRLHDCELDRHLAIADDVLAARQTGRAVAVVVDTREQAAALNTTIRDGLVAAALVDDQHTSSSRGGQPVGAGDLVATRRNDPQLDVANRETWTVTHTHRDGSLSVAGERGQRVLPADYVRDHVELAYASTPHGVQGTTAATSHLLLGAQTTAASAYVGMTRGREANTVHVVAADLDQARDQWIDAFARELADLGPAHAADRAVQHAAGYTVARPLHQVLAELRDAWHEHADCECDLQQASAARDRIAEVIDLRRHCDQATAILEDRTHPARTAAAHARAAADHGSALIDQHARQIRDRLLQDWDEQRERAYRAGQAVLAGPGRLGQRSIAVHRATEQLARWSLTWQPYLPDMPTGTERIATFAIYSADSPRISQAIESSAHDTAQRAHPDHRDLQHAAEQAEQQWRQIRQDTFARRMHLDARLGRYGALGHAADLDQRLEHADEQLAGAQVRVEQTAARIDRLSHEPAITAQPPGWLQRQHQSWQADEAADEAAVRRLTDLANALTSHRRATAPEHLQRRSPEHHPTRHDTTRHGPSIGR